MTDNEQIKAAKNFAAKWLGKGDEEKDYQVFWITFFRDVFGKDKAEEFFDPQCHVSAGKIDLLVNKTKFLIEQKSCDKSLDKAYSKRGNVKLTALAQAARYVKSYNEEHPYEDWIQWIITCNFQEFRIYDVRTDSLIPMPPKPTLVKTIRLRELHENLKYLRPLVDPNDDTLKQEVQDSKEAAGIIRGIRRILEAEYQKNPGADYVNFLNKLCVRLVFLFYADSACILDAANFLDFLQKHKYARETFQKLFAVLNTDKNLRDKNISDDLNAFPYVNGSLFAEEISIPPLDDNVAFQIDRVFMQNLKLNERGEFIKFDWRKIDPAVFGSMLEAILSDERRATGMHYTSEKNIHKVIDPLFMSEFRTRFDNITKHTRKNKRPDLLLELQNDLASINFLDPACGSGNFLTETYMSLRSLENDIVSYFHNGNIPLENPVKVSIHQFFGIELNPFACAVAQVALYMAENKMLQLTEAITGKEYRALPLSNYNQIHCTNALQADWNEIAPRDKLSYIIGNPPFVGFTYQSDEQKAEVQKIFLGVKNLDYVCCWYKKAADFIDGTNIRCAFVSTNSITQGETVARFWQFLNFNIDFAHRTFKWDSESDKVAAVHCVIIGFSQNYHGKKFIFDGDKKIPAKNINPYLIDAPNVLVESRNTPLCAVPKMVYGNKPADGTGEKDKNGKRINNKSLIIGAEDYDEFILREPRAKKYIKRLIGAEEFINGKIRYCLWLVDVSDEEIESLPLVAERVHCCEKVRARSIAAGIRKFAKTPKLFAQITQPEGVDFIIVPRVSSENRRYIPMDFVSAEVKVTDAVQIIPEATRYHFGILISSVHMAWTRAICGRLEMRYRYSKDIVYNNFPWCKASAKQKAAIELTAQKILDVRAEFAGKTLAWLYDEKTMPPELKRAHKENDAEVLAAYGFGADMSEPEIVAALLEKYLELTKTP